MTRHRDALVVTLLVLADLLALLLVVGCALALAGFLAPAAAPPADSRSTWIGAPAILLPALALARGYRAARSWGAHQAVPVAARTLLYSAPMVAVVVAGHLLRPPHRLVAVLVWAGFGAATLGVRLLAGRVQQALYRQGIGVRRAIIVGDGEPAARLTKRIARHPWLGERVLGRVGPARGPDLLGAVADLPLLVRREGIAVVWLAPPSGVEVQSWLPPLIWEPTGRALIWRMLPEDFARSLAPALDQLSPEQRTAVARRVRRDVPLPLVTVAMLGSRGVPARYSGVERYVEEVGSRLAARGSQVAVYCHRKYVSINGPYAGMELRFVPAIPQRHLETLSHTILATVHALFKEEEIIHYHALGPSTLAWLPRVLGRRVVSTVQGLDWQRAKWGQAARLYLRFGEWASARFPHQTIVVSRALYGHYLERYRRPPVYIPNGFPPAVHRPPEQIRDLGLEADGYILFVGRLVPEKGCHTLLQAYGRLRTDKRLAMAGAGIYEDEYVQHLKAVARDLPGVRFLDFVESNLLAELYSNACLVVHPSQMEGLSIALLEALSHGNCCVVSDVPENLEAVGDAAYTFPVNDSDALADRLQWLLDHPAGIAAMRARARARAAALPDWSVVANETGAVYESLARCPN